MEVIAEAIIAMSIPVQLAFICLLAYGCVRFIQFQHNCLGQQENELNRIERDIKELQEQILQGLPPKD